MNSRSAWIKVLLISLGVYLFMIPLTSFLAAEHSREITEVIYSFQEGTTVNLGPLIPVILCGLLAVIAMLIFLFFILLYALKLLRICIADPLEQDVSIIRQTFRFLKRSEEYGRN